VKLNVKTIAFIQVKKCLEKDEILSHDK